MRLRVLAPFLLLGNLIGANAQDGLPPTTQEVTTSNEPAKLVATADRNIINADGYDLAFVSLKITDRDGTLSPRANNQIEFDISGPGEIVATDNGDPTNMVSFASTTREAFNGLCLVIVRALKGGAGEITLTARSNGLREATVSIPCK